MQSKYSIYGGGRWREIDVETGRVAGWACSNFVYSKRGNLVVLKRPSVLRGLKDLAKGHISTVKDGIHLSQIIKKRKKKSIKSPKYMKCKGSFKHKHISTAPNTKMIQGNLCNVSIQCNMSVNKRLSQNIIRMSTDKDTDSIKSTVSDSIAKAITISMSDVETFRNYILNNTTNIFNADLLMFDASDDYKRSIFYKITPIVKVQRHPIIQMLVKQKQLRIKLNSTRRNETKMLTKKTVYCEPRIKILECGESSSDCEGTNETDVIKHKKVEKYKSRNDNVNKKLFESNRGKRKAVEVENQSKKIKLNSNSLKENIDNVQRDQYAEPIKKVFLVKNRRRPPINEFSLLEDEAIVAWIVRNKKGNFVNGNKIWKEMEPIHINVTGHYRSWHSLRNRYLRHLLPTLGSLTLTPSQAADLRAAAATGELKAKKNRNNSIYRVQPVRSAWSARPRKPLHSDDEPSSPSRLHHSNRLASSKLPTYSEITRQFAKNHRSTPKSDPEAVTEHVKRVNKTNKEKTEKNNQTDKPRLSLTIRDTNSDKQEKTEGKYVRKTRERSSRFVSDREEKEDMEKRNLSSNGSNETDTEEEIENNVNETFAKDLKDERSDLSKRRNKVDTDSERRNEKRSPVETREDSRSSTRLRKRSGVDEKVLEHRNIMGSVNRTRENRYSRRLKSQERSITERSQSQNKDDLDTEPRNKNKDSNSRSSRRHLDEEISGIDKKNLNKFRNKGDSDSEVDNKKKDNNSRSSRRHADEEISGIEKKNLTQLRNKADSNSEVDNKKKENNNRSSRRYRDEVKTGIDKKTLRQLNNKDDSNSEVDNKKKDNNSRSSRRHADEEISGIEKKSLRQLKNIDDSESEVENKKKDNNHRSSRRHADELISGMDKKSFRQLRSKDDLDSEVDNKKKNNNSRSSRRHADEEILGIEKKNLTQLNNKNDSESEVDNKKKDNNNRSSRRHADEEISGIEKKNLRQLNNKDDSEFEVDNKKKDNNSRSSRRHIDEEISSIEKKNLRQFRNKDDSESEVDNKKNDDKSRSSRRQADEKISGIEKKNRQLRSKDYSDSALGKKVNKIRENSKSSRELRSLERAQKQRQENKDSVTEETKKQDKYREKRYSRRLQSPETSQAEKKNRRSRGNLEVNEKPDKRNIFSSNKEDESYTDNENNADITMHLRQYRYKIGGDLENADTIRKLKNGNISNKNEKAKKNIHKTTVKIARSKRKRIEVTDSETEKRNKREKRSNDSDSDFVKTSRKQTDRSTHKQSNDSDYSVHQVSSTSKSDFDSSNGSDVKRVTRQSHRGQTGSRDNIIFEITDNDEAYASRSDTDVKVAKRNFRKLFSHRVL